MKKEIKVKLKKVKVEKDPKANVQEVPIEDYSEWKKSKSKNYHEWKKVKKNEKVNKDS